ncbi:hypothetical protein NDU88_001921 [Pleurodeles waltl]|uniref:Secreted protein n=1 Tax=Pleurodeles waltl TaxID=8319 RepID=A0AAV7U9T3_PLEWA|nr:hypothetical protein NDU88_001921 [Pleurodeles waltl]
MRCENGASRRVRRAALATSWYVTRCFIVFRNSALLSRPSFSLFLTNTRPPSLILSLHFVSLCVRLSKRLWCSQGQCSHTPCRDVLQPL